MPGPSHTFADARWGADTVSILMKAAIYAIRQLSPCIRLGMVRCRKKRGVGVGIEADKRASSCEGWAPLLLQKKFLPVFSMGGKTIYAALYSEHSGKIEKKI